MVMETGESQTRQERKNNKTTKTLSHGSLSKLTFEVQ